MYFTCSRLNHAADTRRTVKIMRKHCCCCTTFWTAELNFTERSHVFCMCSPANWYSCPVFTDYQVNVNVVLDYDEDFDFTSMASMDDWIQNMRIDDTRRIFHSFPVWSSRFAVFSSLVIRIVRVWRPSGHSLSTL